MKSTQSKTSGNTVPGELRRVVLVGSALDDLTTRVRAHFEEHQPEPASFPAVASRVIDLAEHPDVDLSRLAHLIEREPAICAAVLAVANSAVNRRAFAVQNIRAAISLLGLKRVASIAVGVACRSLFDVEARVEHELFANWWQRLFLAAMTDAFAASFVAMQHRRSASEGTFLAGMLHDLGKSLGLRSLANLLITGEVKSIPNDEAVEEILRRNRAAIGAMALAKFNMSESLVTLCARQDEEHLPDTGEWTDAHVVRLVSGLNDLRNATVNTEEPVRLMLSSVAALRLNKVEVLEIAQQVCEQASNVSLLFSMADEGDVPGYLELVERCLVDVA